MYCRMPQTVIVVPCYNEARRLRKYQFEVFLAQEQDTLLLFVDDGSRDATATLLKELTEQFPGKAELLILEENKGKAAAVRAGILYAAEHFHPPLVGFFDADLSTPLPTIHEMTALFESRPGTSMVFGSRVKRLGSHIERNWLRHVFGRIFASLVSHTLQIPVYDSQCGAKIFRTEVAEKIFSEPFLSRWIFDVEILGRYILLSGYQTTLKTVCELPLSVWIDDGDTRIRPKDLMRMLPELFTLWRKYHRRISGIRKAERQGNPVP